MTTDRNPGEEVLPGGGVSSQHAREQNDGNEILSDEMLELVVGGLSPEATLERYDMYRRYLLDEPDDDGRP